MPSKISNSSAIVLGGTGAVGSAVVRELLDSPVVQQIILLVRRPVTAFDSHPARSKLQQFQISMQDLEKETTDLAETCNLAFCTLGIGQPSTVSKEELWKVDVEYTRAFAKGCKKAGVQHFSLLSAAYADPKSSFHYLHVKGNAEEAVRNLGFAKFSVFRPSLLRTRDIRYGLKDFILQNLFPKISWALPANLHEISVEDLAQVMVLNAEMSSHESIEFLHYKDFAKLLKENVNFKK